MIYSTCSYSQEEDEDICKWLVDELKVGSLKLKVEGSWGIVESEGGYRFYPDQVKGEGFFIAAFKKTIPDSELNIEVKSKKSKIKQKPERISAKEIEILKPYLIDANDFFFIKQNDEIIAMPAHLENDLAMIRSSLYIKKAGVKLGTLIRNELIPSHELAVSNIIHSSVPRYEVDKETALQYLRKEEIKIDTEIRGWVLLTHGQLPLGWVKAIPNRINNYYPSAWRILNK